MKGMFLHTWGGASRKGKAEVPPESHYVTSVETQTDDFVPTETASVSTQTDVIAVELKDAAVQADSDNLQVELSAHTDDRTMASVQIVVKQNLLFVKE